MSQSSSQAADINSNLYNLYVQNTQALAQTLVIKLDQVAQAINNWVQMVSGITPDPTDRTTWKYYQNITGTYHFTDTPMVVESLDTQTQISFDKVTLQSHPTTLAAYAYGSYYYNELVAKYGDGAEMLILGILYPADMTTAINAVDGTILSYPPQLVEPAETSLIVNLQTWIINYLNRWVVGTFANSDNLYIPNYVMQLTFILVLVIQNLRLRACKTNQAHSFHIGQYLRSHGLLDFYLAELNQEQTLDLYRNINYYVRNAGFQTTFEALVDLLMTKRNLPLYQYVFKQNAASIQYVDPTDTTNLIGTPTFQRVPLNAPAKAQPLTDFTLTDVFALSNPSAPGNEDYQTVNQTAVQSLFELSSNASLGTKILESTLGATSSYHAQAPQAIIFNHWLALTMSGVYTAGFQFTPPGSTIPIQLSQPQAVALWFYALFKAMAPTSTTTGWVPLTLVPQLGARYVIVSTLPSFNTLRALTTTDKVTDDQINEALSLATPMPTSITTVDAFSTFTGQVYQSTESQFLLSSFQEDPASRAQLQYICDAMYTTVEGALPGMYTSTSPYTGKDYIDVLSQMGFTPGNYSALDYYNLTLQLYEAATGANLDSVSNPVNVQAAMIQLLTQLSSYSIQVVSTTNQADVTVVGRPDIRISDFELAEQPYYSVDAAGVEPTISYDAESDDVFLDWDVFYPLQMPSFVEVPTYELDLGKYLTNQADIRPAFPAIIPNRLDVTYSNDPQAMWASLTTAQQQALALMPPPVARD